MKYIFSTNAQKYLLLILSMYFLSFNVIRKNNSPVTKVSDFRLMNVDGSLVSMSDYPDAKGFIIIFTCNHCPFAKLYPPRMNELNSKYSKLGVPLIAVSSSDTLQFEEDTFSNMIKKSEAEKFNFPYLFDGEQTVAKDFNAQKTPHAFVLWKEKNELVVKYNGAIDDNGADPDKVNNPYVAEAVNALLLGNEIEYKVTKSIGCQIKLRK